MTITEAPSKATQDLIRAHVTIPLEFRADTEVDESIGTLRGHFAVFNTETIIDSWWEGRFREVIAPGAFKRTIDQRRDLIRCIYEHGHDPMFGRKPLGSVDDLREDSTGAYYEVGLFDSQLNREHIIPAARAGELGASFAFSVLGETWDDEPEDDGLPVRTITEVKLHEFGPCPFAAYAEATADMRSLASNLDQLDDARLQRWAQLNRQIAPGPPAPGHPEANPTDPPDPGHAADDTHRAAFLRELQLSDLEDIRP